MPVPTLLVRRPQAPTLIQRKYTETDPMGNTLLALAAAMTMSSTHTSAGDHVDRAKIFRVAGEHKSPLVCYILPSELFGIQFPTLQDIPFTVTFTEEADGKYWANGQPLEAIADQTGEAQFEEAEEKRSWCGHDECSRRFHSRSRHRAWRT